MHVFLCILPFKNFTWLYLTDLAASVQTDIPQCFKWHRKSFSVYARIYLLLSLIDGYLNHFLFFKLLQGCSEYFRTL